MIESSILFGMCVRYGSDSRGLNLAAEFISKKVYTFSSKEDHIIPNSLMCTHSASMLTNQYTLNTSRTLPASCGISLAGHGFLLLMIEILQGP